MVFSSTIFLFVFLPIILLLYFLTPNKYKNVTLLFASLFFYAWGEPRNILIMLLSILVNYILAFAVAYDWKLRKIFLVISIIYNLGILYIFKYLNFSINIYQQISRREISFTQIILPIGISFYTFQIMSYVIDVYRKKVRVQKNLLFLALYISLFPQLIAGPIVRYIDVEHSISYRNISLAGLENGALRFMIGFAKKILIADQLSPLVDIVFAGKFPSVYGYWIGIIAYTLQIYFDFSGYSDMAIGLGKIFGFEFDENFNHPYIALSIQDFWRRWHISLSHWFRDYLYIPLGGSRNGQLRTCLNLLIVFFLTGLWHGASYNFIVWGLLYAVILILERMGFNSILQKTPKVFRHIYTLSIVMFCWIFFRANTLQDALSYISGLFNPQGNDFLQMQFIMNRHYWFTIFAGILFSYPISSFLKKRLSHKYDIVHMLSACTLFILAISYMIGSGYSPFLYFRF